MKGRIDINCDMGESYGKYDSGGDLRIMPYISSCNIACGFHSGDPLTIERTIQAAIEHKLAIGAHPSFPDLQGFGRRRMHLSPQELGACIRYQVGALKGMVESLGSRLDHVKLHGALYHQASSDSLTAEVMVQVIHSISSSLKVYGPPASALSDACLKIGLVYCREGFADRRYEDDLSLRSREYPDALLEGDEAVRQALQLALRKEVKSASGAVRPLPVETICLHSDTPGALSLARSIYQKLGEYDLEIHTL